MDDSRAAGPPPVLAVPPGMYADPLGDGTRWWTGYVWSWVPSPFQGLARMLLITVSAAAFLIWSVGNLGHGDPICIDIESVQTDEQAIACGYDDLEDLPESFAPPLFRYLWLLAMAAGSGGAAAMISWIPRRQLRQAGPPATPEVGADGNRA